MVNIPENSRAEYYKERRKERKHFSVLIDRRLADSLEKKLAEKGVTKATWLKEKIYEELNEQKK